MPRKPAKKVEEGHSQRNALSATPVASITWVRVTRIEEKEVVTSHLPHHLRHQVQRHTPLAGTTSTRAKMEARKNVSYLPYYIPIMILKFYSKKLI